MIKEKQKLIKRNGIPVTVYSMDGYTEDTVCLFGRATKQFNNTLSLEYHRRAHFFPGTGVESGCMVINKVVGEKYIVVSTFSEVLNNKHASTIVHMLKCNTGLNVSRDVEIADKRGNIKKTPKSIYADLSVYTQSVTMELRETKIGLFPETDYLIYAPDIDVGLLDRVSLNVGKRVTDLKIVAIDYISYPGLVCIEVSTETRK